MNIRSLNKHYDEVLILLNELEFKYDILIFTETHIQGITDDYKIEGYSCSFFNSKINKADGIVIYFNMQSISNVKSKPIVSVTEANAALSTFTFNYDTYEVISMYRSPSTNIKSFIIQLDELLNALNASHRFLIGDTIIDILETSSIVNNKYQMKYKCIIL